MNATTIQFIGGPTGQWEVEQMRTLTGTALAPVSHIQLLSAPADLGGNSGLWALRGVVSNMRYAEKQEVESLAAIQPALGRSEATRAALIPLRKAPAWWTLAQDERRAIFEQQSHHTQTGLRYLPAIARKLYHCRDLGEPFDFLTWFEYAPANADRFEELLTALRASPEWQYVDREVDIRLVRR